MGYVVPIDIKMQFAKEYGLEALHYCPDTWAIRHYWAHTGTGDTQRARCNKWECAHCGPRKVDLWRQLVRQAEPTLFLTLTKAGATVQQARRALTTFMQALRRGSKGRGKDHKGAREAYPIEYFAVLEKHSDFERNGFHWHLLIKGVDHIPYVDVIKPLWMSATHYQPRTEESEGQGSEIGWIARIRSNRAIGYVTKYLMKTLSVEDRGTKQVKRERVFLVRDEDGHVQEEKETITEEVVSKAHRICYSQQFFPEQVEEMRKRLFAGLDHDVTGDVPEVVDEEEQAEERSGWVLMERQTDGYVDVEAYKQQRYQEMKEELQAVEELDREEYEAYERGLVAMIADEVRTLLRDEYQRLHDKVLREALESDYRLSRRVIGLWDYQRQMKLQYAA